MKQSKPNELNDIRQEELDEAAEGIDFSVDDDGFSQLIDKKLADNEVDIDDAAGDAAKSDLSALNRRSFKNKDSAPSGYKRHLSRRVKYRFKKSVKTLIRMLIVVAIVAAISLLYVNRDDISAGQAVRWISENVLNRNTNEFPVTISGSRVIKMDCLKGNVSAVSDTSLMIIKDNGRFSVNRQHNFSNPSVKSSAKSTMTYEIGSNAIYIDNRSSAHYELDTDNKILAADMNAEGFYSYATRSGEGFMSEFYVYNSDNQLIFKSRQTKYLITDISISNDCKTIAVLMIGVEGGDYVSMIKLFDLKDEIPVEEKLDDTLIYKIKNTGEEVLAISQDVLYLFDMELIQIDELSFVHSISGFELLDNGNTVLILNKEQISDRNVINIVDKNCSLSVEISLSEKISDIKCFDNFIYILTPDTLYRYNEYGDYQNEWNMQGSAKCLAVNESYAYVCDGDSIFRFSVKQ